MKIQPITFRILFTFLISTGMSFFMSIFMHIWKVGMDFLNIWLEVFAVSAVVSFPVALLLVFVIDKFMKKLFVVE
ncbi:MAG: hypothetical protein K0R73_56 [Candidatus Midichloriaceae bacterium]|nr:hypothetical protein [Candidatus Midichloriaceae bacterium]